MSNKSSTLPILKSAKKPHFPKKSSATTSLYSGVPSAQRAIQQQRISPSRMSTQLKRGTERTITGLSENRDLPENYHPWKPEYRKIVTRQKNIKSMTKDPYTPMTRLISQAVEGLTTESECFLNLIPAKAVTIETVKIQQAPKTGLPTIVRYLRRNELMPSEQLTSPLINKTISLSSQSKQKKPIISFANTPKTTGIAPTLVTSNRLLNRAKLRTDSTVIQRPPRKLVLNVSHETIMPLSAFG